MYSQLRNYWKSKSLLKQTFQFVQAGEKFVLLEFEFIVEIFPFPRHFMTGLRDKLVECLLEKHFLDIATRKFSLASDISSSEHFPEAFCRKLLLKSIELCKVQPLAVTWKAKRELSANNRFPKHPIYKN